MGKDDTRLHTSMENCVDWLANGIPPWTAYRAFISGRLIALDKQPGIRPSGVGATWRHIFSKIVLKVMGKEAIIACSMTSCVPDLRR